MGGTACKGCSSNCNSGCAFCRTDGDAENIMRLERRYIDGLSDLPLGEKQEGSSSAAAVADAAAAAPEVSFELDVEEMQADNAGPLLPEGARASRTFRSGAVYSGQWRGRTRHGLGFQSWPDGASYAGQWANSKADGRGVFNFPDGSAYVGLWRKNRFHGLGAFYDISRTVYRGEWLDGLRKGRGVEDSGTWPGTKYAGIFSEGMKDGPGVCTWSDGGEYCGQWRGNQITGCGTYACSERRRRYKGEWVDSQKHGIGFYEWPDGRVYQGQYWQDQASGFGSFAWPDGQRYEGHWQNGKQHGAGQYTGVDGTSRHLMWVEGRPQDPPQAAVPSSPPKAELHGK